MVDQAQELRKLMEARGHATSHTSRLPRSTRFIAIASGKGGVGKTNFATNLAVGLSLSGLKTVLIDADLGMANLNLLMGVVPRYNLSHLMEGTKSLQDIIVDTEYGVALIPGATGIAELADASERQRSHLVDQLAQLEDYDFVLIDTSAGGSKNVLAFLQAADDIIIVTTPEPTAITDAYGIIKILSQKNLDSTEAIRLVINRVASSQEASEISDKLINIASQFLNIQISYLGYVYEDKLVGGAVRRQKPFMVLYPNTKASYCVKTIASELRRRSLSKSSKTTNPEGGVTSFLRKVFGKNTR